MSGPVSFEEYVAARWSRLVRSTILLGADPHTAEDLVQTALTRCHRVWDRVLRADDPDAYVHRVLLNARLESRRRRWWGETPTVTFPDRVGPTDLGGAIVDQDAVSAALQRLPIGQRRVVVLRYYADLTEAQTATVLGVPVGTVMSRAAGALKALAEDPDLSDFSTGPGGAR